MRNIFYFPLDFTPFPLYLHIIIFVLSVFTFFPLRCELSTLSYHICKVYIFYLL
jgi:hypothetical protein